MPRKKKVPKPAIEIVDPTDRKNLKNYTEVDGKSFWKIYKQFKNKDEYLKVIDTGVVPMHLVWTEYLNNKK